MRHVLDTALGALALVALMAWCALCMAAALKLAQLLPLDGVAQTSALAVVVFVGLGGALWTASKMLGFRRM